MVCESRRSGPSRVIARARRLALGTMGALLVCGPLGAQSTEEAEEGSLRGVVLDALTGTRLEGARVQLVGVRGGTLTDSAGVFVFEGVPVGWRELSIDHYGFEPVGVRLIVEPGAMDPVAVELNPEPVMLDGVDVVTDRLEQMESRLRSRRRAVATSTRAFDLRSLTRSPAGDMLEFLRLESLLHLGSCGRGGSSLCLLRRGRWIEPRVYVDEAPLMAGLDQLATYRPGELYLVEVYGRGVQIRAYTHGFMERMARRPMTLIPILRDG